MKILTFALLLTSINALAAEWTGTGALPEDQALQLEVEGHSIDNRIYQPNMIYIACSMKTLAVSTHSPEREWHPDGYIGFLILDGVRVGAHYESANHYTHNYHRTHIAFTSRSSNNKARILEQLMNAELLKISVSDSLTNDGWAVDSELDGGVEKLLKLANSPECGIKPKHLKKYNLL